MTDGDTPPTVGESPELIAEQQQAEPDWAAKPEPVDTEPAPEPIVEVSPPETPAVDALPSGRVRVSVAGPLWVSQFVASDTLTVDRLGVFVPEGDVPDLLASASKAGTTLKVG